uniref:PID domain-containing protein n=1 Tax=Oryzias latipes TaxID=8090 RepID=A0A3P9I7E3_ORYLA
SMDTSEDHKSLKKKGSELCLFLGRVEVVRSDGLQILEEAVYSLKTPDKYSSEKVTKNTKVLIFLSLGGIDILEHKTKFLLYQCPLSTVSFCAVLPSSPKVFGFVAKHPASDIYHCYLFQSKAYVSNPLQNNRNLETCDSMRHPDDETKNAGIGLQ